MLSRETRERAGLFDETARQRRDCLDQLIGDDGLQAGLDLRNEGLAALIRDEAVTWSAVQGGFRGFEIAR